MDIYQPYTYLIGWSQHNKFYYGVRFAAGCTPKDLWVSYFTSSKHVQIFREKHGEPDIIQIRKTFLNATQAKIWEENVLRKMNVILDKRFLNKNINGRFIKEGPQSKEHIEKRVLSTVNTRKRNNSYVITKEHRKKLSEKTKGITKPFSRRHAKSVKEHIKKLNSKKIECPHCGKNGQYSNMKRWHFENCKSIP